jgi:hypothetical protein
MSCGASAGCSSCSCGAGASGSAGEGRDADHERSELEELIREAQRSWSVPLDEASARSWDVTLQSIASELAGGNAQSMKPLLAVCVELGEKAFLEACSQAVELGLTGVLLCWAFEFAHAEPREFLERLRRGDADMIDYVNAQAVFYECFPNNPKVGRAKTRASPATSAAAGATAAGHAHAMSTRSAPAAASELRQRHASSREAASALRSLGTEAAAEPNSGDHSLRSEPVQGQRGVARTRGPCGSTLGRLLFLLLLLLLLLLLFLLLLAAPAPLFVGPRTLFAQLVAPFSAPAAFEPAEMRESAGLGGEM